MAGLNLVYGMTALPLNGPILTDTAIQVRADSTLNIQLEFDQPLTYDSSESTGFYVCCDVEFTECDNAVGLWQKVIH